MNEMLEEAIVFECAAEPLVGILHRPAETARQTGVLVVVGGPQYRVGSHRQFTLMARALAGSGYPVMRFDLRGMGDSPAAAPGFEHAAEDIDAGIAAFLSAVPSLDRLVLWGLCDGASAILIHGCRHPRVQGLVLANPWVHSEAREAGSYVRHYYGRRLLQRSFWRKLLSWRVDVAGSLADWLRRLVASRDRNRSTPYVERMLAGLCGFQGGVLILLSEQDLVARQFEQLCRDHPEWSRAIRRPSVTVRDVAGADHTFSERAALDGVSRDCAQWLAGQGAVACQ
jgi:exosortase A-associated hydrolase 1